MNTLFGGNEQIPLGYTQEQQSAMNDALGQWRSGMANPTAGFEPIAQNARQRYQENVIPTLMERVRVGGLGGAKSAYGQGITQGLRGLESDLAAQQAQYGLSRMGQLNSLLSQGLTKQYDSTFSPGLLSVFARSQLGKMGEQGIGNYLSSFGKPQDASKNTWGNLLGQMGTGAATGGGIAGPWGAAGGAILPLIMRLLGK